MKEASLNYLITKRKNLFPITDFPEYQDIAHPNYV
jgi:hypothetical protein